MQITDVRVRKIAAEGKMKAIVSVTFDNEFVVHDIKVIEGQNGLFIAMPSRKTPDGEFKDIAHPINTQTREKIQKAVLDEYKKVRSHETVTVTKTPIETPIEIPIVAGMEMETEIAAETEKVEEN
jgi:stage V sporulation protein G